MPVTKECNSIHEDIVVHFYSNLLHVLNMNHCSSGFHFHFLFCLCAACQRLKHFIVFSTLVTF
jgi:hypothetical protein